jgi:DNA-binding NarL/FixJ family response regulator
MILLNVILMAKATSTHLFCLDDHKSFSEDVKKRFSDTTRYTVGVYHNREDFINHLIREKEHKFCKVAILGLHNSKENLEMIDHLTIEIKNIDRSTGIIILSPPERIDEIKRSIRFNIDSYIPRNANAILRIHNTVKRLISEHSLLIFRKRRNFSFYVLIAVFLLSLLIAIISYFKLPVFF